MKGQNEHVTNFSENGWTDLEDLGIRGKVWMSYALTMEQILHMAPGVPAPVKIVPKKFLQKSAAICYHCQRRALRVCSFLCVCPAQLPWVHQGEGLGTRYHKATCRLSGIWICGSNLNLVSQQDLTLPHPTSFDQPLQILCGTRGIG